MSVNGRRWKEERGKKDVCASEFMSFLCVCVYFVPECIFFFVKEKDGVAKKGAIKLSEE